MQAADRIPSSEITPEGLYFNRRSFVRAGVAALTAMTTGLVYRQLNRRGSAVVETPRLKNLVTGPRSGARRDGFDVDEQQTPLQSATNYNNFYEFTTNKEAVASAARGFVAKPWSVTVDGLVKTPRVFDLEELLRISPAEERVYRMRCVEAWSMVIPWAGYSLSRLLDRVEPLGKAKYVAFETLLDPERMPGQRTATLEWPYVEGLRLDEAMHPLTLLASGLYGRELPAPNGAPLRLVGWSFRGRTVSRELSRS